MKTQNADDKQHEIPAEFCEKLISSVSNLSERLAHRYEASFPGYGEQIRNAITEAETLAWETTFPHLFFPDFAEARVECVVNDSPGRFLGHAA